MKDADLYKGFSPEKQAEHEKWLVDRYGEGVREHIEGGRAKLNTMTATESEAHLAEIAEIEAGLADAMAQGSAANSPTVTSLVRRHHAWVARAWPMPPTKQSYAGLADLYLDHADFRRRYDAIHPDFAQYVAEAIRDFAERELKSA